ncbi:MAG TPA: hypothetical protein PLY70_08245 [Saprospiraceae bacterium]|nr:hypothetical protein [Saprospiraceae bacterium]HPN69110.1 hypothetical protein [Saprospiraceae bacterium]
MRKIKIANVQKRDAEIVFGGLFRKPVVQYKLQDGTTARNIKVLKSDLKRQYDALFNEYGSDESLSKGILEEDPEIDLNNVGKIIGTTQKVLINPDNKPVYKVKITEVIYNVDGSIKDEKPFTTRNQNILSDYPISWTGKQIPIDEAYNKFIFAKKYQLTHNNGLTFDFLFAMAKELHGKKVMMLLAAGAKGNEPLIFQENGRPYRAFLEGRIIDESYLLIMHISNLELKPIL